MRKAAQVSPDQLQRLEQMSRKVQHCNARHRHARLEAFANQLLLGQRVVLAPSAYPELKLLNGMAWPAMAGYPCQSASCPAKPAQRGPHQT